jgi:hypothetical protein
MARLILRSVDVEELPKGKRAVVLLEFAGKTFSGNRMLIEEQSLLKIVAHATLNAINEVLYSRVKAKVDFHLHHAEELMPEFIDRSLFVVSLDAGIGQITLHLVGTVVADGQGWAHGIASATLDSTNRLIAYLLQLEGTL